MTCWERLKNRIRFGPYARLRLNRFPSYYLSCSQFGEDMVVRSLLDDVEKGFYVDVGAHHPVYYSNTYHFYMRGWRGINIDPLPGGMEAFDVLRPRDVNLEMCIGPRVGEKRTYFVFEQAAYNTCDPGAAAAVLASGRSRLKEERRVDCMALPEILDRYMPADRQLDLLSLDVEGLDEDILRSLDWDRYRPRVITFERHGLDPLRLTADPLIAFLAEREYRVAALCGPSVIVQRQAAA
jgi:FkbM family methyltransferase